MLRLSLRIVSILLVAQTITSCLYQTNPELAAARTELAALRQQRAQEEYTFGTYEHFVSHNDYPATLTIYKNPDLMPKAAQKCRIIICLEQQRGRLYVGNEVAADWPVSTGLPGHDTPAGNFSVQEKKPQYSSNRYGKMYNSSGKCINYNADAYAQAVPEGGHFVGSPMPFWMRLTWDGVGMHVGVVRAGKKLSHGCIRTPRAMAEDLYNNIVRIGTRVSVIKNIEPEFPAREAMAQSATLSARSKRIQELQQKIADLERQEQAARS